MGWLTTEELVWDSQGRLATHAPSTYKIPTSGDVPAHFKVNFWHAPNREDNVFGSKAVGEPPFMLAISVWEAIRDAVAGCRASTTVTLDAPATAERVHSSNFRCAQASLKGTATTPVLAQCLCTAASGSTAMPTF